MNLVQVEIEKGQEMLHILKNYVCMASLLDEFRLRVKLLLRRPRSSQGRHRKPEEEEKEHPEEAAKEVKEEGASSRMKEK